MFVQVISGRVSDPAALKAAGERWERELAPGATGWLGTTAGATSDGRYIALARFDSEEAARRNSDRPEQGAWWADTAKLFTDEPTFRDSLDVLVDTNGDPGAARFVQVMRGGSTDPDRAWELMQQQQQDSERWAAFRPDVLGSVAVRHEGGDWTMALYFTSEADAREGERKEPPPEMAEQMREMDKYAAGPPEFLDLPDPWLSSPR